MRKHHVSALLELDVSRGREKIRALKARGESVSFTAWLIALLARALEKYPEAAAYRYGKRRLMVFEDIHVSIVVEKELDGRRVPIPMVIEQANRKSVNAITGEIAAAKRQELNDRDVVLGRGSSWYERLYYHLPDFARRAVWTYLLRRPRLAFAKMGNVVLTSVGMIGTLNGWFIHRSVHPISFGIGSIIRKPVVVGEEIRIREILNATVLLDHDLIDGAPMVRCLQAWTRMLEEGAELG
jgi:pyruvate/2-oxoglutarate dehydrogenase complex dihydrolipoamide acyltransferase (E2) component